MKEQSILDIIPVIGLSGMKEGPKNLKILSILKTNLLYHKITTKKSSVEF